MKKDVVRREFLKLKLKDYSYKECQERLKEDYEAAYDVRTLKRWYKRFRKGNWNLRDKSTKPKTVYYRFAKEELREVVRIRRSTGYSAYQLKLKLQDEKGICMSQSKIKAVIRHHGLSRGNKMQGQRLKWVRFERDTPNSMWQFDGDQQDDGSWVFPVEDDCSRYCLAIALLKHMTTEAVIAVLEDCIRMHGKPREFLTDNGPEFGGNGKGDNEFDKWCEKQGIKHIRSGLHKPTTVGKVSRIQFTIEYELPYCFNDYEYFRWRYNHERPHRSLNGLTPAQVYFGYKRHKKYNPELLTIKT